MFEKPAGLGKTKQEFRHELIQEEFRSVLENANYEIPDQTDGIMVLSASPRGWHNESNKDDDHPEDIARIKFGIEIYKKIASKKLHKPVSELTDEDLKNEKLPLFILNGATEQQSMMERIASSLGLPPEKTVFLNCGNHSVANTRTQFTKVADHSILGKLKHLAVVSTGYHVPRVARTASVNLPKDVDFDILGVPVQDFPFNVYRNVKGEVQRIIKYSEKGDISRHPRTKEE